MAKNGTSSETARTADLAKHESSKGINRAVQTVQAVADGREKPGSDDPGCLGLLY